MGPYFAVKVPGFLKLSRYGVLSPFSFFLFFFAAGEKLSKGELVPVYPSHIAIYLSAQFLTRFCLKLMTAWEIKPPHAAVVTETDSFLV